MAIPSSSTDLQVLFVDYDNVLQRCDSYVSGQNVVASEPGVQLFEFAAIFEHALGAVSGCAHRVEHRLGRCIRIRTGARRIATLAARARHRGDMR